MFHVEHNMQSLFCKIFGHKFKFYYVLEKITHKSNYKCKRCGYREPIKYTVQDNLYHLTMEKVMSTLETQRKIQELQDRTKYILDKQRERKLSDAEKCEFNNLVDNMNALSGINIKQQRD